ncbi:MAG: acyltransferase [Vicinamibacteria bacterium]
MFASAPSPESRWPWIDTLRGLAILSVVLLHIDIRIPMAQSALGEWVPREVSRVLFRSGYYGVRVFFVISGFLITSTLLRRMRDASSLNVRDFYARRFARIAPCLLVLLGVLSVLHLAPVEGFVVTRTTLGQALFSALTFHVNELEIAVGYLPAPWDVLWSLSIEEIFYIVYPLVLFFVRWTPARFAIAAALITIGPLARTSWATNDLDSDYAFLAGFDGIAIGCLAAFALRRFAPSPRVLRVARLIGLGLMLLIVVFRGTSGRLGLGRLGLDVTVLAIGAGLFLWSTATLPQQTPSRVLAPLRWLGRHSYEVYLTHSFLTIGGLQLFRAIGSPRVAIPFFHLGIVTASAALGALVVRYLSEPANRALRDRFSRIEPARRR